MKKPDLSSLPIFNYLHDIAKALVGSNTLILQADPGAGKSTAVPLFLLQNLDLEGKKIVMLEPRRLAAKSIAEYLAKLLGESVGESVGYQVRHERKVSAKTRLEVVTEGILTQRIQQDPALEDTGLVIFDEFHERSIHADFGLTLCKDIRSGFNDTLKILVMSATIDTEQLSAFLGKAPIISSEGRCYPVETLYLPKPLSSTHGRDWLPALQKLVTAATEKVDGDVLVFLPGKKEILHCEEQLKNRFSGEDIQVVPLYGSLKPKHQQQALLKDARGRQKVILATNIAETSLTIENIGAVVDSGLERVALYDVSSGMTGLQTKRISQASAEQRQGRAGRMQAGVCYRLWSESQHQSLMAFSAEEITTSDLTRLQIGLSQWGVSDYSELSWLTQPPKAHISAARKLLESLAMISDSSRLTAKGKQALRFNTEPRFACLLTTLQQTDDKTKCLACDLVAVLMDSHFYQQQDDADLSKRLLALQAFRSDRKAAAKNYPVKHSVAEQVVKTARNFALQMKVPSNTEYSFAELQNHLGAFVALIFPDRIAKRRGEGKGYQLANGKGAMISEWDSLLPSDWLAVADLDGQRQEGRIYLATPVEQNWLEQEFGFAEKAVYRFDSVNQKIVGRLQRQLGKIVLAERPLVEHDQQKFMQCLQRAIIDTNLKVLPWQKTTLKWLDRVNWLASQQPRQGWPDLSRQGLLNHIEEWLFPYLEGVRSIAELQQLDLLGLLQAMLPYDDLVQIEKQAPETYRTPSGKTVIIDYQLGQLPKVSVVLQEVFGELKSPQLAWGTANLTFELLSPARRPIQVTSDLANFWQSSYFEVAKEMKGRYPKHRWPEQPLLEKPGRSIKPKK